MEFVEWGGKLSFSFSLRTILVTFTTYGSSHYFSSQLYSLKATILAGRIYKKLNVEIPLKEIFSKENIKGFGEYIESISRKQYEAIEKVEEKEY